MRHWIAAVGAWLALVAVWLLPPEPRAPRVPDARAPEVVRYDALKRQARRARDVLQRMRWSDSLSALVASSPEHVLVGAPRGWIEGDTLDLLREALASRVDRESRVTVGFFVLATGQMGAPGIPVDTRTTWETYVGSRDGRAYCLRALVTGSGPAVARSFLRSSRRSDLSADLAGVCRLVARYGLPGPDVMRWLTDGGTAFAARTSDGAPRQRPIRPWSRPRAFPLGSRWNAYGLTSVPAEQCLAQEVSGCARVFLDPSVGDDDPGGYLWLARHSPALAVGDRSWRSAFASLDDYVLSDLENRFGRRAFARFWTSEAPVEEAFRTAFGVAPGPWMLSWLGDNTRLSTAGPGLPMKDGLGAALALLLCALVAAMVVRRRSPG
jgi:hypothetical protein